MKPQIDPQDPLPESNWLYRRATLIGSIIILFAHRSWQIYYTQPLSHWTDFLILAMVIAYTVAPSAEQVSKMIATVALFRIGPVDKSVEPEPAPTPAPAAIPAPAPQPPWGSVSITLDKPPWER